MMMVFIGASSLPFVGAYWLGKHSGIRGLAWGAAIFAFVASVGWGLASFLAFKEDCKTIPKTVFFGPPSAGAETNGFLQEGYLIHLDNLIETGTFQFVEQLESPRVLRRYAGPRQYDRGVWPVLKEFVGPQLIKSDIVISQIAEERVKHWWRPPISIRGIQVTERKSGRVLAKAIDLVLGGGLMGTYMRFFGGDQDFEHMSCGYASNKPSPFRPTLTNRPEYQQYLDADVNFLTKGIKATSK
jgi:hypothetical protein